MGDLILLDAVRLRSRGATAGAARVAPKVAYGPATRADSAGAAAVSGFAPPIQFYFDLVCPFSYLAAEQVERLLGQVQWVPVSRQALYDTPLPTEQELLHAEGRAHELRLPLSEPEWSDTGFPSARRVAAYAGEVGAGGRFALAALRLAFCGGYDLEDPEILAEAAAAAGLGFDGCLAASYDELWDEELELAARRIVAAPVTRLPAFRIGDRWFEGEEGLLEAVSELRRGLAVSARLPA